MAEESGWRTTLASGLSLDPCNFDLLYALFAFHAKQNNRVKAAHYIERLKTCFPGDQAVVDMYNDFFGR